jgi:hypothetical protein
MALATVPHLVSLSDTFYRCLNLGRCSAYTKTCERKCPENPPPAPALPMWHCEADDDSTSKEETEAIDGIFYENYALNLRVMFAILRIFLKKESNHISWKSFDCRRMLA